MQSAEQHAGGNQLWCVCAGGGNEQHVVGNELGRVPETLPDSGRLHKDPGGTPMGQAGQEDPQILEA